MTQSTFLNVVHAFQALSLNQLGDLSNFVSVLIPVLLSLAFWRYFEVQYFRSWTFALIMASGTLVIDFFTVDAGHPVAPTSLACLAYVVSTYFYVATAAELANRAGWARSYVVVGGVTWLLYLALAVAGLPFELAFLPGILQFIGAQLLLAWVIAWSQRGIPGARWLLAGSCLATGLVVVAYPVSLNTPYLWLGFLAAALTHLVSGLAMLVFALSEVALTLKQANEELRKVDRLQTTFLGNLNHELRTPFQALQTAAYLLTHGPDRERLSGQQRETVAVLGQTVDQLFQQISDLVDFSTMAQGALRYDREVHELGEVVEASARGLADLFGQAGLTLVTELPDAPVHAEVDGRRLGQVVSNLLTNALKFTPPGGTVTVRLWQEGPEAWLEVRDTGLGIPPGELEPIFQRFYQVDASFTRKAGGHGLGLAICKAIVEEGHGGRIWAESDGKGAVFKVVLPLAPAGARAPALAG